MGNFGQKYSPNLRKRSHIQSHSSSHIDSQIEAYIIHAEKLLKIRNVVNFNNQRINIVLKKLLPSLLLIFSIAACGGEKEILAPQISGIRTTIERILINQLAFDAAQVAVEGIAHDISEVKTDQGVPSVVFKLTDRAGNFIDVSIPTSWVVEEDDYVVVGGIYRRSKNEIEAQQLEVIVLEEDKKEQ